MTNDIFSFNTNNFNKYLVGFDKVLDTLHNVQDTYTKAATQAWPFYNIVKTDENKYRIDLAIAGFGKNELNVELANNTLVISGSTVSDETSEPVEFLFKGIADRSFTRKFTLADHVEVKNAEYINGLLKVYLEHMIPEAQKSRKVDIK